MPQRVTKQYATMSTVLGAMRSLFDADDFFEKVCAVDSGIGIATVYRFLKRVEQNGEVHSFICDKRKIYSRGEKSHVHFTCERCQNVSHVDQVNASFLSAVRSSVGDVCHFQLDMYGLCKRCEKEL